MNPSAPHDPRDRPTESSTPEPRERGDLPGAAVASLRLAAIAFLLAGVALTLLHLQSRYLVDDGFITFRYARNWIDWGAPVFSRYELAAGGTPVEGYSNLLWVALLAGLHALDLDLPAVATWVQLGLGLMTLGVVAVFARGLGLGATGVVAAPLLLATSSPFAAWTSGGMETTLFGLLLFAGFAEALRGGDGGPEGMRRSRGLVLGALGAGIVWVRAEGIAWAIGLLGAVALAELVLAGGSSRTLLRARARLVVALGIPVLAFAAQLAWRRATYGEWLPNTVVAKSGGASGELLDRGLRQVASWALVAVTPLFAAALAIPALLHGRRRARVAGLASLFVALGFALYGGVTGGDWMPFFRFLAPASAMLALLVAIGLDRFGARVGGVLGLLVLALQPLALFDVHLAPAGLRESLRFRSFEGGYSTERGRIVAARKNLAYFSTLGHALHAGTGPGDVLAFGAIGSTGWYAPELDFLDRNGLVTPEVARRSVVDGDGTAGHEKRVPHAWFLDHGDPAPNLLFATWRDGLYDPSNAAALDGS